MQSIPSSRRYLVDSALRACACAALAGFAHAQALTPQWVQTFDGPASYDDGAAAVAADASGNLYVAGNVYVSPQSGLYVPQMVVLKYSSAGQLLWSQQWGTGYYGGNGVASHVALAPNGNVIVAGQRDLGEDWVVLAYSPGGALVFETVWLANSWYVSSPADLAIDAASNVYLCGDYGDPIAGAERAALIKVDASGALSWARTYDGSGDSIGTARALALGGGGAIYITGGSEGPNAGLEFSVARVDASGAPVWRKNHWTLDFYAYNFGVDVAVAPGGAVIAAGTIDANTSTGSGISAIAYDAAGTQLWRYDYNPTFQLHEFASGVELDASGNVYVAGFVDPTGTAFDALLLKLSSAGQLAWERQFPVSSYEELLRIDAANHAVLVARDAAASIVFRTYDGAGTLLGAETWSGPASGASMQLADCALVGGSARAVVGSTFDAATGDDVMTAQFDGAGGFTTHAHCTGKLNSAGCTPSVAWSGTASLSSSSAFAISAMQALNQKNGLFFYGTNGPAAAPFGGGTICAAQPVRRTPLLASGGSTGPSDCTGVFTFDFNAWLDTSSDPTLSVGAIVDGQFWYRDPLSTAFIGLSNGIEFRIEP